MEITVLFQNKFLRKKVSNSAIMHTVLQYFAVETQLKRYYIIIFINKYRFLLYVVLDVYVIDNRKHMPSPCILHVHKTRERERERERKWYHRKESTNVCFVVSFVSKHVLGDSSCFIV